MQPPARNPRGNQLLHQVTSASLPIQKDLRRLTPTLRQPRHQPGSPLSHAHHAEGLHMHRTLIRPQSHSARNTLTISRELHREDQGAVGRGRCWRDFAVNPVPLAHDLPQLHSVVIPDPVTLAPEIFRPQLLPHALDCISVYTVRIS